MNYFTEEYLIRFLYTYKNFIYEAKNFKVFKKENSNKSDTRSQINFPFPYIGFIKTNTLDVNLHIS